VAGMAALLLGLWLLRGPERHDSAGTSLSERLAKFRQGIREVAGDRRVVLTSAMEGVQNMGMGALEAFLPVYAVTRAGLSELEAGLLWAVQIAVTMVSKPVLGRLGDVHGRKAPITAGLICCALGLAAVPWLASFWTLAVASLVFGLGEALVTSSSAALVADLCRKRHYGAAMGTFGTIFDVGHAAGPILGGVLVAALDFRLAFAVLAVVLLAAVPVFLAGVSLDDTPDDTTNHRAAGA
jgi:DHA1 family multidrug resistance protein-like MFS transporter